jgi:hypothetical protein
LRRFILVTVAALTLGLPAAAEDPLDCARWSIKDLRLGMTFEEVLKSGREFKEVPGFVDPLGYTRYAWQAPDALEKVEVHVDYTVTPDQVFGLMTTIPAAHAKPKEVLDSLIERWGPPATRWGQGAFTLYTWTDESCDVSARIGAMNDPHDVAAWILLSSTSRREEFERRKRAARRAEIDAVEPHPGDATAPSPPGPTSPDPPDAPAGPEVPEPPD